MTSTERTNFALAWDEAEERKAEAERLAQERAEAAALEALAFHVYDPHPYAEAEPFDTRMYEGTGIGALYGFAGSEWALAHLGDWRLGKEPVVS